MRHAGRRLAKSTVETWISIGVGIAAVVFEMTWQLRLFLLLILAGLIIDLCLHAPLMVHRHRLARTGACLLSLILLGAVSWSPLLRDYYKDRAEDFLFVKPGIFLPDNGEWINVIAYTGS